MQDCLIHSILKNDSPVNRKYLEQTETKQTPVLGTAWQWMRTGNRWWCTMLTEALQKENAGEIGVFLLKKSPRLVACSPGPGSNSPEWIYRTASFTVYATRASMSTGNIRDRRKQSKRWFGGKPGSGRGWGAAVPRTTWEPSAGSARIDATA